MSEQYREQTGYTTAYEPDLIAFMDGVRQAIVDGPRVEVAYQPKARPPQDLFALRNSTGSSETDEQYENMAIEALLESYEQLLARQAHIIEPGTKRLMQAGMTTAADMLDFKSGRWEAVERTSYSLGSLVVSRTIFGPCQAFDSAANYAVSKLHTALWHRRSVTAINGRPALVASKFVSPSDTLWNFATQVFDGDEQKVIIRDILDGNFPDTGCLDIYIDALMSSDAYSRSPAAEIVAGWLRHRSELAMSERQRYHDPDPSLPAIDTFRGLTTAIRED
jgi:hypothetical protein